VRPRVHGGSSTVSDAGEACCCICWDSRFSIVDWMGSVKQEFVLAWWEWALCASLFCTPASSNVRMVRVVHVASARDDPALLVFSRL
jgi:hypothetical protein